MVRRQYKQTTIVLERKTGSLQADIARHDDTVNAHLDEMARSGWELVTTTTTIDGPFQYGGSTKAFHFIWKKAQ